MPRLWPECKSVRQLRGSGWTGGLDACVGGPRYSPRGRGGAPAHRLGPVPAMPSLSRRCCGVLAAAVAGCLFVTGGQRPTGDDPQPSVATMSAHSTFPATASPFSRDVAPQIVDELVQAAGGAPVTKVDITSKQVSVTVRVGATAQIWSWQAGQITSTQAASSQTVSRPFNPDSFALERISQMLSTAATVAGSRKNQELQVLEYNQGVVLISVSTRPETAPVFFRPNGSLINTVDFATTAGMTEALRDAVDGSRQVLAISYQSGKGVMVDTPSGTDGIMVRRTRPAALPAWAVERRGDTSAQLFSPSDISPTVLAGLMAQIPITLGKAPLASQLSFRIDMSDKRSLPTIHFSLDGSTVVTDITGKDITSQVR